MADASLDHDTLESLIDEYTRRLRNGEHPTPEEYAGRRPELSEKILAFFPALQFLVELGPSFDDRPDPSLAGTGGPCFVPGPTRGGPEDGPAITHPVATRVAEYEITGELGRGGMGAVFRGRDSRLGRDLAVKVLLDRHQDRPRFVRRFLEEARISGQLQHPGVVPIYELGSMEDQRPYFTMKLVQGRTLADLLGERPSRAHDQARFLAIFEAICQTVAYAHSRGVIHRDLKPANVMVGSFGEVQVLDWGLAKFLARDPAAGDAGEDGDSLVWGPQVEGLSEAGSALGTPAYMAPEQARGELDRVDERADVFSLGSMLCAILTGQPAFTGRSQREILRKAMRGDLAEAWDRLDHCGADPELLALARDAMAPEFEGRPGDAGVIVSRLTAYLLGVQERLRSAEVARGAETARAEAATRVAEAAEARARAERRSRRLQAGLASSLIGLILLGGGGYVASERQKVARAGRIARAVDAALADAALARDEARLGRPGALGAWDGASSAVRRAEALLAQGEIDAPLRGRVASWRAQVDRERAEAREKDARRLADRDFLAELETIRAGRSSLEDSRPAQIEYAAAFRKAGLDLGKLGPVEAGRRVASRLEPAELAGYLDDWAFVGRRGSRPGVVDWHLLVEVARAADPDPWRDALRARLGARDQASLAEFRRLADDEKALDAQGPSGLVLLARELLAIGEGADRERATRILRKAATRHPGDFWVHIELGTLRGGAVALVSPAEAARHLGAATALRPDNASARHELACILLRDRDQVEGAVAEFREAIRLNPDRSWSQVGVYETLGALGRLDREIASCRREAQLHPDNPWAHANLASALKAAKRYDEAIGEFRKAIELKPRSHLMRAELGGIYYTRGMFSQAIEQWDVAVDLKPDNRVGHINLGLALARSRGPIDEVAAEFRKAIAILPDLVEPHVLLGDTLSAQGKPDEAAVQYGEALRLSGDLVEVDKIVGNLEMRLGPGGAGWDAVIARFQQLTEQHPENPNGWHRLALAHLLAGDHDAYRQTCDEAMRKLACSKDADIGQLARACLLVQSAPGLDRAIPQQVAESAAGRMPSIPWWKFEAAVARYRSGDYENAIAASTSSIDVGRGWDASPLNWPVLAMANWKLGRRDEARKWLDKAKSDRDNRNPDARGQASGMCWWFDRTEFRLLLHEAEDLIEHR